MSLYFALSTVENNKKKMYVKFQGDMLNFCDFIQVFVFTTNHHLNSPFDTDVWNTKQVFSMNGKSTEVVVECTHLGIRRDSIFR